MEQARVAHGGDVERVLELARALRDELSGFRGGELWARAQDPPDADSLGALLGDPGAAVVVGTFDDAVVGYAVVRVHHLDDGGRLAAVTELFVEPGAREVGVGEAVVGHVIEWAGAQGCLGIDATALPGHRAAKNFFEEQGFIARSLTMHRALPMIEP